MPEIAFLQGLGVATSRCSVLEVARGHTDPASGEASSIGQVC